LLAEKDAGDASWDSESVRQALLNLIDNAIKHGRAGGHIEVGVYPEGENLHLLVRDDGPGIVRRDRRRIFGRFQRGTTEAPGAGLGLYLVDQVARSHGGRVDLVTEDGKGSTFTLILPRVPLPTAATTQGTRTS
jgi:signal transduction histidine kinase